MSRLRDSIQRALRTRAAAPPDEPATHPHPDPAAPHGLGPEPGGFALPAGEDPDDPRPTALRRGRLRKRLRYLERRRELLLRDLGGLVFEIHRSGTTGDREHQRGLVAEKVARIVDVDVELASGRRQLGEERGELLLREPGVGGLCANCGEVHGSDAAFCPACGHAVQDRRAVSEPLTPVEPPRADPVLPDRPVPASAAEAAHGPGNRPPAQPAPPPARPAPAGSEPEPLRETGRAERPTRVIRPEPHPDGEGDASHGDDATRALRAPEQRAS